MKNFVIILLLLLFSNCIAAQGKDLDSFQKIHIIKVSLNPFQYAFSSPQAHYERFFAPGRSFALTSTSFPRIQIGQNKYNTPYYGLKLDLGNRFYFKKRPVPKGGFMQPFVSVGAIGGTDYYDSSCAPGVGAGLLLGRQWLIRKRFSIELAGGIQGYWHSGEIQGESCSRCFIDLDFSKAVWYWYGPGAVPLVRFNAGYAF